MHFIDEQPLEDKLTVATNARGDTLAKGTKSEDGIIGSQPRGNHNVLTHYPKDPNCKVCKMTQTTRARCKIKIKHKKRVDVIASSSKFGDLIATDHQILSVEKRVEVCTHRRFDRAR